MHVSPNNSQQTPRSIYTETVEYSKQLEDMLESDKSNGIIPQIQLDELTICCYEQVLHKGLSGDLKDLGQDSRYQEFNKVLTALLACRRIPSESRQAFLSLRHDLPSLASRACELKEDITQGLSQRDTRKELESCSTKYRSCVDHLLNLKQEKEYNMSELARLGARNQVIDSEINRISAKADALQKVSASQSLKISNLDVGTLDESTLQHSIDDLHKMEDEWRNRVDILNF